MPTYSYACTTCEHRFDTVQAFTDSSLTECPECTGRLRKLYSNVGIVFKGSGFYRNDSRAGGAGERSESSESGTDSKAETSSKSETKPEPGSKSESDSKSESSKSESSKSESGTSSDSSGTTAA